MNRRSQLFGVELGSGTIPKTETGGRNLRHCFRAQIAHRQPLTAMRCINAALQCWMVTQFSWSHSRGIMKRVQRLLIAVPLVTLIFAVAAPIALRGQDRSSAPTPNTVWVGADGKYEAEPDTALMQFSISAQEDNLQAANARAT